MRSDPLLSSPCKGGAPGSPPCAGGWGAQQPVQPVSVQATHHCVVTRPGWAVPADAPEPGPCWWPGPRGDTGRKRGGTSELLQGSWGSHLSTPLPTQESRTEPWAGARRMRTASAALAAADEAGLAASGLRAARQPPLSKWGSLQDNVIFLLWPGCPGAGWAGPRQGGKPRMGRRAPTLRGETSPPLLPSLK